ncbi:rna-directed dna polymerase from mobile element jockey-like [Pitangus sulphuratus]|nr:rna-directed dna polymerase from mobile element jockey-like [Pitangus sulphuratus]
METSDKWCPSGISSGPILFNVFVDNIKTCGAVNTLEGKDVIQRDLDRLEKRACVDLRKFNKAKCKVPHVSRDNPRQHLQVGQRID